MWSLEQFKSAASRSGIARFPDGPRLEFYWSFDVKAKRAALWEYVSDTSRFNRHLGMSARTQTERKGEVSVTTSLLGFRQEWIEAPWNWISGQNLSTSRSYTRGIAREVYSVIHLSGEDADPHRTVHVFFSWIPRNRIWSWFLSATAPLLKKQFGALYEKIDLHLVAAESSDRAPVNALYLAPEALSESAEALLCQARATLIKKSFDEALVDHLVQYVRECDSIELASIQVIPLSERWGVNRRDLLRLMLTAASIGILRISWQVICPHCRGSRFSASSLGVIPEASSCDACAIDFGTDETDAIEVTFHVHSSIRKVEDLLFCAAEPAKKPHILLQIGIEPGQEVSANLELTPGSYRIRQKGRPETHTLEMRKPTETHAGEVSGETNRSLIRWLSGDSSRNSITGLSLQVLFANESAVPALVAIERVERDFRALRPSEVLSMPEFRHLFSSEHLALNVKLYLEEQTILFTDIVGSTQFYAESGDAKAFARVSNHFHEVFGEIERQGGVVVKTIGDAVMASFSTPSDAIAAARDIQGLFHSERRDTPLRLRISIHSGPVLAVHLNTGVDYFGGTVNLAAKIQSGARGGEIAVSEAVYSRVLSPGTPAQGGVEFSVECRSQSRDVPIPIRIYVITPRASVAETLDQVS